MTHQVIVRSEAKGDIREHRSWYHEISPRLAADFMTKVDEAILLARERPLAFQIVHRSFRRILLHRFPYALFYYAGPDRIVIVAVLHQSQDREILERRQ